MPLFEKRLQPLIEDISACVNFSQEEDHGILLPS